MNHAKPNPVPLGFGFFGFLMLYPVFFWYHIAIAFNVIPTQASNIFGGLYGVTSSLILVLYLIFICSCLIRRCKVQKTGADWIASLFLAYISWAVVWALINLIFLSEDYTKLVAIKLFKDLVLQSANFIIGSFLVLQPRRIIFPWIGTIWILMLLFVFANYNPDYDSLYHALVLDPTISGLRDQPQDFASYQGLARSTLMTSFLLIALTRQHYMRFSVEIISAVALYIIGARSEFVGFLIAICFFEFALAWFDTAHMRRILFVGFGILIGLVCVISGLLEFELSGRVGMVLDISADLSWQKRLNQLSAAIETILGNPIFGDFDSHFKLGGHGDLPHNILAAWTMLGVPGFLMIATLMWGSCNQVVSAVRQNRLETPICRYALLLSAMAVPLILIAKSPFVEWLPLVFGCVMALAKDEKERSTPISS